MKHSLLIGRWQPFHKGHQALVQTLLDEGKNVCVAIRDTEIDEDNPFTAEQRRKAILSVFPQVKVIIIPDIEEVVYGRKVGWNVREVRLNPEIEQISGTEIRKQL